MHVELSQPGFSRALVDRGGERTRVDWAHDSAWRFMPPVNKTLALAGRDEPRDYVDIIFIRERILPLGALCWAAAGKDPGFTPLSLLELLRRRGRHRPEEIARLALEGPADLVAWKQTWLTALDEADILIRARPGDEVGCLYYATDRTVFVAPDPHRSLESQSVVPHYGSPGGVLPRAVPQ